MFFNANKYAANIYQNNNKSIINKNRIKIKQIENKNQNIHKALLIIDYKI